MVAEGVELAPQLEITLKNTVESPSTGERFGVVKFVAVAPNTSVQGPEADGADCH